MSLPAIDFAGIDPQVVDELAKGRHAREVLELTKLKQRYGAYGKSPLGAHRSTEGLGRPVASIPPLAYHYWGRRLGYECWQDKQFLNEIKRDNPGVVVESAGGTKAQVGYREPRFKKHYSWPSER